MRLVPVLAAGVLAVGLGSARTAFADDVSDVKAELDALKQRIDAQDRKIRSSRTRPRPRTRSPPPSGATWRRAGLARTRRRRRRRRVGRLPARQEALHPAGPQQDQLHLPQPGPLRGRSTTRTTRSASLTTPADTLSGAARPATASGFEIERLYFGVEGTVFCPDITYQLMLNFDSDTGGERREGVRVARLEVRRRDTTCGPASTRCRSRTRSRTRRARSRSSIAAMVCKAFALGSDTGVTLWGYFGDACECPKQFMYKVAASTGEGTVEQAGSVFNTDAFDTYSDQLLFSGDARVEHHLQGLDVRRGRQPRLRRPRAGSTRASASARLLRGRRRLERQVAGRRSRSGRPGPLQRSGHRRVVPRALERVDRCSPSTTCATSTTRAASTAPDQTDSGAEATLHYRFADSNWGVGAKAGIIWLDSDYRTRHGRRQPGGARSPTRSASTASS